MKEIYISTDIEANGPIPGEYSMLSLGSVAIGDDGVILGQFYRKLKTLPNSKEHPQTMSFWDKNKEAYAEATSNPENPEKVMNDYANWLEDLKKKHNKEIHFLAYPATWDFMFVSWYLIKLVKRYTTNHFLDIPLGHAGIDIKSFSMAQLKKPYSESGTSKMPKRWLIDKGKKGRLAHKAIDDALEQGLLFIRMLKENRSRKNNSLYINQKNRGD
ncbi:exonuclease [Candidatus Pacearchaeota archaeon]|nr:exonuclease [Candidatus Pacearchaeota archaeon]